MDVLGRDHWYDCLTMLNFRVPYLIFELRHLGRQPCISIRQVVMFNRSIFDWQEVMVMLLLKGLGICDGLDRGVVIWGDGVVSISLRCQNSDAHGLE